MHPNDQSGRSLAKGQLRKWRTRALLGATALTAAVSFAVLDTANSASVTHPAITNSVTAPAAAPAFAPGMPASFANLVERVSPAVVTIEVDKEEPAQLSSSPDGSGMF